jgi:nucleoside-diphosphate-sugar epimerase
VSRGQSPQSVRILDFRTPGRKDLASIDFVHTDITSVESLDAAFSKQWPEAFAKLPLTVFHTAATIRPNERAAILYERVSRVNVDGTRNVIEAAKSHGADVLVATSSASVSARPLSYWIPPWQRSIKSLVQVYPDPNPSDYRPADQYFGNYPKSKAEGEKLVLGAATNEFKTGVIRPACAIYGGGKGCPDFTICEFDRGC